MQVKLFQDPSITLTYKSLNIKLLPQTVIVYFFVENFVQEQMTRKRIGIYFKLDLFIHYIHSLFLSPFP